MQELLHSVADRVELVIEAVAILIVALGCIEALIATVRLLFRPSSTNMDRRDVWLMFARWLVAALTFQLAADIVSTSFAHDWVDLGRVGAVAAIRTGLSFFLDREVSDTRALQHPKTEA